MVGLDHLGPFIHADTRCCISMIELINIIGNYYILLEF
jgi:hypothetical protein